MMIKRTLTYFFYFLGVVAILGAGIGGFNALVNYGPKPIKVPKERFTPTIEVYDVVKAPTQSLIEVQGFVETPQQTTLSSEVKGKVIWVSEQWIVGGKAKQGDILLKVEDIDYQTLLAQAEASLANAQLNLEKEIAQGEQALKEWESWRTKDSSKPKPSNLVLHIPQRIAAEADVKAAQISVEEAKRQLDRCMIKAPYDATLSDVMVHLGSYVNTGEKVCSLFSEEKRDLKFSLTLKESERVKTYANQPIPIKAYTQWGEKTLTWTGMIDRWTSTVQRETLSPSYIARLNRNESHPQAFQVAPIGLFLQVQIEGDLPETCYMIPSKSIKQDKEAWIIDQDNKLKRVEVKIISRSQDMSIVTGELKDGDKLCITLLESPIEGMSVHVNEK